MNDWDLPRLRSLRLKEPYFTSSSWDEAMHSFSEGGHDCFSLFGYIPVRGIQNDDERYVNRLVLDLKEAKASAVAAVATLVKEVFLSEPFWIDQGFRGYAVAAPSSKVGIGSPGINQLLRKISHPFPVSQSERMLGLTLSPWELNRITALQTPSHQQKKTAEDHLATIEAVTKFSPPLTETDNLWAPDSNGPRVIVFDDVYTRGATFSACSKLLADEWIDATYGYDSRPSIAGFFVAKTWARNAE